MSYGQNLRAAEDKEKAEKAKRGSTACSLPNSISRPAPAGNNASSGGRLQKLTVQEARSKDGRTELELLQSTQRSLAEADDISTGVLGTLHEQTEQIERIRADSE